ncbi:MAG: NAD(P)-binding protein [Patescibacteria group bacterium]|nr:NAD(P)-binding protein [Patescibacteria group bacterium]
MKVAIVGGGISGLYLAWKLSEKGEEVWIFEKKNEIGNEICSGLVSERILEFIPESKKLIKNEINSAFLHFPKKTVKIKFSKNFLLISHFDLDKLVSELAQKAGAKIVLNNNISSIPKGFDRIIGCDGANSFVRNNLNTEKLNHRIGILGFTKIRNQQIYEEKIPANILPNLSYVETWPIEKGFLWKIPYKEKIEYGIISTPLKAKKLFDNFLIKNKIFVEEEKLKLIPQNYYIPKNKSITLCGDAAGLTKPWSGGGIIWGLKAAEILLNTFPNFISYKKSMDRYFRPKIFLSKNAVKLVYFLGFKIPWLLPKNNKIESDFLI